MDKNLNSLLHNSVKWYRAKNRWWLPLIAGLFYSLCQSPFNHVTHPVFFLFPFISFIIVIPLFVFSLEEPLKRAALKTYLFGITASLTQFYWLANVTLEGLWHLIMLALFALTLFIGLLYLLYGMLFRFIAKRFGSFYLILFPVVWIIIEYVRTLGDMSFPWALLGYALTPILALAQLASITGVYGLSFIIIFGNIIILELIISVYKNHQIKLKLFQLGIFSLVLILLALWGGSRLKSHSNFNKTLRIALIQNNMDQGNWNGMVSLDTSMAITEQLLITAAERNPDLIILPESGVYCYLERSRRARARVIGWSSLIRVPMIFGTLHFKRESDNPYYKYKVYNAVFSFDVGYSGFEHYYKIKLVPFSEALPFEGAFPILSRVNLGESDFHRGSEEKLLTIRNKYYAAPFICYEIIYPDFVRRRVNNGANLLINVTNDGWWGRSNGPFHHATMARMRSIENGVSLARCANSGISMLVDPVGRIIDKKGLYKRAVLTGSIPYERIDTFYSKFGDWIIRTALIIFILAIANLYIQKFRKKYSRRDNV